MDDDQITSLAREYAEYKQRADAFKVSNKEFDASDCEAVIHFLLRRYCLVEKSKVKDAYMSARKDVRDGYKSKIGGMIAMGGAKGALLESLFPEIAKEVENEKD